MDQNERMKIHGERDRERGEIAAREKSLKVAVERVPPHFEKPIRSDREGQK